MSPPLFVRLIALTLTLTATPALAFEQTMTCSNATGALFQCGKNETPKPVCWSNRDISYLIQIDGSDDIRMDSGAMLSQVLEESIQSSFAAWTGPECAHLDITFAGTTPGTDTGFMGNAHNTNLIVWREDWPYDADPGAYALTSVTFSASTGTISDVDIELNGEYFTWSVKELPGASEVDVRNTMTHEVGHFIGLDHSLARDSTMFASAPLGETIKRTLSQDDVDAVCTIYGPQQDEEGGCGRCGVSATPTRPLPHHGLLAIGLLTGLLVWRRRGTVS